MMRLAGLAIGGVALCCVTACEARRAEAPRRSVDLQEQVRDFAPHAFSATRSRTVFLWPSHVTGDQVSRVIQWSLEVDGLEDRQAEIKGARSQLDRSFADVGIEVASLEMEWRGLQNQQAQKRAELEKVQQQMDEVSDPEIVAELEKKALKIKQRLAKIQTQMEEVIRPLQEAGQYELWQDYLDLGLEADRTAARVPELTAEIGKQVEFQGAPLAVILEAGSTGVRRVRLEGLRLNELGLDSPALTFDLDEGTVVNAHYERRGGVWSFELVNDQLRIEVVKLARTRYAAVEAGEVYKGDLVLHWNPEVCKKLELQSCERRGVLKLQGDGGASL